MLILILLESKVKGILNKSKNKKAPGHVQVTNEPLKYAREPLVKLLTKHYNKTMQSKKVPEEWNKSIPKKVK